jgi:hypothetical protein
MLFNFAVVFDFNVFPFPPGKAESLGDVPIKNRKRCCEFFASVMSLFSVLWSETEIARKMEMGREM